MPLARLLSLCCTLLLSAMLFPGSSWGQTYAPAVVGPHPVGMSMETWAVGARLRSQGCAPLAAAMTPLGSPTLRIGGNSQDHTVPMGSGSTASRYRLQPSYWERLGCLVRSTGQPVVIGLNLGRGSEEDARQTIAAARIHIPAAQLTFSVGNEPDLYARSAALQRLGWPTPYSTSSVTARRTPLLDLLGPSDRVEGPDMAGRLPYDRGIAVAAVHRERLQALVDDRTPAAITVHGYAYSGCSGTTATPALLAQARASWGVVDRLRYAREIAVKARRPLVLSEANSVACRGRPGVSDHPITAVWSANLVGAAMAAGISEVRLHNSGSSYDPITVTRASGRPVVAYAPAYRGLQYARHWLAPDTTVTRRSRLLSGVEILDLTRTGINHRWFSNTTARQQILTLDDAGPDDTLPVSTLVSDSTRVTLNGRVMTTRGNDWRTRVTVADATRASAHRREGRMHVTLPPRSVTVVDAAR